MYENGHKRQENYTSIVFFSLPKLSRNVNKQGWIFSKQNWDSNSNDTRENRPNKHRSNSNPKNQPEYLPKKKGKNNIAEISKRLEK